MLFWVMVVGLQNFREVKVQGNPKFLKMDVLNFKVVYISRECGLLVSTQSGVRLRECISVVL